MISNQFYFQLLGRVVILTLSAILLAFCWYSKYPYLVGPIGLIILLQMLSFVLYFNQTNRKIAYLFESIKNEDFSFQFPEQVKIHSFKQLYQSLNQVNQQIRDQKKLQAAQEKYYQGILETATIGIFTTDTKGHILFANPRVRKLLNLDQLTHLRQLERTAPNLYIELRKLTPFHHQIFEISNEREHTQLLVSATKTVLHQDPIFLVVIQNIRAELDQKETESWSKLIRVMTHEIMNTVAPITSVSESILKHYFNPTGAFSSPDLHIEQAQKIHQGLQIIKEQGQGLIAFVQAYRSLLNIPKPNKTIINVSKLVEKIHLLMTKDLKNKHIELVVLDSNQDFEIFADEQQLTQVFVNLIKNAIQALPSKEEGRIEINYGQKPEGQKFIKISDNGPGIAPDIMDQIFIPFYTTKANGTGTGLSLVKQIMSLHGGRVEVHSPNDAGAEFILFF